jgi:hypothetical protein
MKYGSFLGGLNPQENRYYLGSLYLAASKESDLLVN